jgi:hypothetical protein
MASPYKNSSKLPPKGHDFEPDDPVYCTVDRILGETLGIPMPLRLHVNAVLKALKEAYKPNRPLAETATIAITSAMHWNPTSQQSKIQHFALAFATTAEHDPLIVASLAQQANGQAKPV